MEFFFPRSSRRPQLHEARQVARETMLQRCKEFEALRKAEATMRQIEERQATVRKTGVRQTACATAAYVLCGGQVG